MLVLAEPRLEEDVPIRESFWEPGDMEMLLLDTLIDPNPIFPITALAARARHRDKVRSLHRGSYFQMVATCRYPVSGPINFTIYECF